MYLWSYHWLSLRPWSPLLENLILLTPIEAESLRSGDLSEVPVANDIIMTGTRMCGRKISHLRWEDREPGIPGEGYFHNNWFPWELFQCLLWEVSPVTWVPSPKLHHFEYSITTTHPHWETRLQYMKLWGEYIQKMYFTVGYTPWIVSVACFPTTSDKGSATLLTPFLLSAIVCQEPPFLLLFFQFSYISFVSSPLKVSGLGLKRKER